MTDISVKLGIPLGTIKAWRVKDKWVMTRKTVARAVEAATSQSAIAVANRRVLDVETVISNTLSDCKVLRDKALEMLKSPEITSRALKDVTGVVSDCVQMSREALNMNSQAGPQTLVQISMSGGAMSKPVGQAKPAIPIDTEPVKE